MNKKLFLLCLASLIVVVICLLYQRHETVQPLSSPTIKINQAIEQTIQNNEPHLNSPTNYSANEMTNISGVSVPIVYAKAREDRLKDREEAAGKVLDEWRAPIEFYGKVLDESNFPISNAQVSFSCNDLSHDGTSNYASESDANGLFFLTGVTGKLLVVHVSKPGYYSSKQDNDSFEYGDRYNHVTPNPGAPIIFHLRKTGSRESLVTVNFPAGIGQIAQLHHDGTPEELDLQNGTQVAAGNGQLKLEFWRDLSPKNANVYDWKIQLSVVGGGLVQTSDEFAFQAPENGYEPSLVIDMPATNQNWVGELQNKFYIRRADGKYGRIDFYLLPYNGVFRIHSVINPTGSRNLEPTQ